MGVFDWLKNLMRKNTEPVAARANVDWAAFEVALTAALEVELAAFAAQYSADTFYGLALDCNAYYADILLCANTQKSLDDAVTRYTSANDAPDVLTRMRSDLTWSLGDWQYQGFNLDSAPWQVAMNARLEALAELPAPQDTKQFLVSCCRSLIAVERGAAIGQLNRTADFKFLCIDHDESFNEGEARLNAMRVGA
jgi:Domain of unknown function (DUF4303)